MSEQEDPLATLTRLRAQYDAVMTEAKAHMSLAQSALRCADDLDVAIRHLEKRVEEQDAAIDDEINRARERRHFEPDHFGQ
jgi:hypothetical protein